MLKLKPKRKTHSRTEQAASTKLAVIAESRRHRATGLIDMYDRQAMELMKPVDGSTEIMQGEAVPLPPAFKDEDSYSDDFSLSVIRDTLLQDPDTVAIDASCERTRIIHKAGALEIGLDAAKSIRARNSLEKMLVHQMAVCHVKAMEVMTTAADFPRGREDLQVKMLNVAARLMDTYQKGMDTLTKTRNAGNQTITVKQVNVTGGQNVITDTLTTGGHYGGD